jgi:hypothetical protein
MQEEREGVEGEEREQRREEVRCAHKYEKALLTLWTGTGVCVDCRRPTSQGRPEPVRVGSEIAW